MSAQSENSPNAPLITAPQSVVGYHGCSRAIAETILAEQRFVPSTKAYDWLGEGIYFWEYAPYRALDWAMQRCGTSGEEPAVIGATIQLGVCLNLLDTEHTRELSSTYEDFVATIGLANLPRNTKRGAHYLDRFVVDSYCRSSTAEPSRPVQTVRGSFAEGNPIFDGSMILDKAHTQIAVRDATCLSAIFLVQFP